MGGGYLQLRHYFLFFSPINHTSREDVIMQDPNNKQFVNRITIPDKLVWAFILMGILILVTYVSL